MQKWQLFLPILKNLILRKEVNSIYSVLNKQLSNLTVHFYTISFF